MQTFVHLGSAVAEDVLRPQRHLPRYQDEVFHDFVEGSCADMAENHAGPGKTLLSVSKSTVLLTQI